MSAKSVKYPVSERALVARINRKLKPELETLRRTRSQRMRSQVGDYYIIDLQRNAVLAQHVDLEELGRKMKALEPWEVLSDEDR